MSRCQGINKGGRKRCGNPAPDDGDYCHLHVDQALATNAASASTGSETELQRDAEEARQGMAQGQARYQDEVTSGATPDASYATWHNAGQPSGSNQARAPTGPRSDTIDIDMEDMQEQEYTQEQDYTQYTPDTQHTPQWADQGAQALFAELEATRAKLKQAQSQINILIDRIQDLPFANELLQKSYEDIAALETKISKLERTIAAGSKLDADAEARFKATDARVKNGEFNAIRDHIHATYRNKQKTYSHDDITAMLAHFRLMCNV
jgi:DNA repair exonuclease SbcCD ATPase subunit